MRASNVPEYLRDRALGMLPHRAPTGLIRIGRLDRDSPVLVTGNFTLTVRRLRDALQGYDAWLLVANSKGRGHRHRVQGHARGRQSSSMHDSISPPTPLAAFLNKKVDPPGLLHRFVDGTLK